MIDMTRFLLYTANTPKGDDTGKESFWTEAVIYRMNQYQVSLYHTDREATSELSFLLYVHVLQEVTISLLQLQHLLPFVVQWIN